MVGMKMPHTPRYDPYPSDVSDEEWSFVAPHPASRDRAQVEQSAQAVQQITGRSVILAYVDQGCTGETAKQGAQTHGTDLEVVKHTVAKRGFVLLPRRWVVERGFAWAARFRRLARDCERLTQSLDDFR